MAATDRTTWELLQSLLSPAAWYGVDQALLQRNTFPPTADPHHNGHWWVMAIVAFIDGGTLVQERSRAVNEAAGMLRFLFEEAEPNDKARVERRGAGLTRGHPGARP